MQINSFAAFHSELFNFGCAAFAVIGFVAVSFL
jgi:hypothetical protein